MRILIFGGSGFIGRAIARTLESHEIAVVHRGTSCEHTSGIRHVHCRSDEFGAYRTTFRDLRPDVALDLTSRNAASASQTIHAVTGIVERVVVASSVSVYRSFGVMIGTERGPVDAAPLREDAPLRTRLFPYRLSEPRASDHPKQWLDDYDKVLVEQAYLGQTDLAASIARLPMVYGPRDPDERVAAYLRWMRNGELAIPLQESASAWRNARGYVENVAAAIAQILLRGAPSCVYNVAEPEDFTEAEWILEIAKLAGWNGEIRLVPDGTMTGRPSINEFPAASNFAQHLRMDTSRIRRDLGYIEPVSLADALRSTIEATD